VLLFWALDRLTREGTLATLQYLERLTSYHVGYKSFTEPYLDSCGTFKDGKRLGRPPLRVLTPEEIVKLRRERARSKAPFRTLAMKYGMSVWTVHKLCSGRRD
jgi:DNA invertase Pin-like site-specific DNA recombinase